MKTELEYNLAEEFEFMREESTSSNGVIANLYNVFEIDIGDGWYQLLYDMCKEIAEVIAVIEMSGKAVHIVVDQIKEKYGALRFYYHLEGMDSGKEDIDRKILDIVEKYEDMSEQVCETCGSEGTLRKDLIWMQTLCDTCYAKHIERFS